MFYRFLSLCLGCFFCSVVAVHTQEIPSFQTKSQSLDAGYIQLNWQGAEGANYTLQESTTPNFEDAQTLYQGTDKKLFISGRENGELYYRLKTKNSDWTRPLKLTVKHHSQQKAMWFLLIGFIVFITTLVAILYGAHKHKNHQT